MKNNEITVFSLRNSSSNMNDFEEAFQTSMRRYSLRQLNFMEDISEKQVLEALQKSMNVCRLAGVNSMQHFKKIYVYDDEISTMHIDWRITKKGLNLMVMRTPSINEKIG